VGTSRAITEAAMNEIDFKESFNKRMALLEGLSEEVCRQWLKTTITKGAHRLKALKYYGYKRLFLSGGFTFFGN
jgi:phosphoserine phosphatase